MATSRETLKDYFRKYALPTEQQFAELIDAFVHKDEDLLTQEKIDGLISALESKVSAETFESFKTEIQNLVTEAGGGYDSLAERMSTVEDNVSGHETRIKTLEDAPKGNFVERCSDLDSYTEAEDGKIVMYDGETNEKYHRGWFYEKVKGEGEIYLNVLEDFYDSYERETIPAGLYKYTGNTTITGVDTGSGAIRRNVYELIGPNGKTYWVDRTPDSEYSNRPYMKRDRSDEYGEDYRFLHQDWEIVKSCKWITEETSWQPVMFPVVS